MDTILVSVYGNILNFAEGKEMRDYWNSKQMPLLYMDPKCYKQ